MDPIDDAFVQRPPQVPTSELGARGDAAAGADDDTIQKHHERHLNTCQVAPAVAGATGMTHLDRGTSDVTLAHAALGMLVTRRCRFPGCAERWPITSKTDLARITCDRCSAAIGRLRGPRVGPDDGAS